MTATRRRCALLAVLVLLTGLVVATPAQAAPGPIRVMTFNICGNVCRKGEVPKTAGNVAYQVVARRVGVTFLQEVCYSQFLAIRKRLLRRGYHGVFAASTSGGKCDDHDRKHGSGFGNAILVRGPVSGRVVRRLPIPSPVRAEARTLLGTSARLGGRWVFLATTHTAPSGPNLSAQLAAVRANLAPMARRRPVILGGDLNSLPESPALDDFYSARVPDGRGVFREMHETAGALPCRCGSPTFRTTPRKIDYVFASAAHFRPHGATTIVSRYSDHRMYVGVFGPA